MQPSKWLAAGIAAAALTASGTTQPTDLAHDSSPPGPGPAVHAPIAKGQQVARIELDLAGQPRHTLPLVAVSAVAVAGPFDTVANALLGRGQ